MRFTLSFKEISYEDIQTIVNESFMYEFGDTKVRLVSASGTIFEGKMSDFIHFKI